MNKKIKTLLVLSMVTVSTIAVLFTGCGKKEAASTSGEPHQDEEEYIEPKDERILDEQEGSNDKVTWTKSVISYEGEEDADKLQYINATINAKELPDFASVSIVVDYNNMAASATVTYFISGETNVSKEVTYTCDENGITNPTKDTEIRDAAQYEEIISDMVYTAFH